MNTNTVICNMKNKTQQNNNVLSGIFLLMLVGGVTSILMLLKYFNILHLDLEIVLAPFLVISLLTYGDRLLIFLLLSSISFVSKLINKLRSSSQSQQQLTLKQS